MIFSSERQTVRFLHTGDWHLDSPFSRLSPVQSEERRRELRDTFSRMTALIGEHAVDLVLIAGDLFDREFVTADTADCLLSAFRAHPRCRFIIAPGNHDPYRPDSLYASDRLPDNVFVFSSEALSHFDFPDLSAVVYGWAFLSDRLETSPLSGRAVADPSRLNLLCAHGDLGVPLSKYAPVTAEDVARFGAQYAAFAHKHVPIPPTPIGSGLYAYCGCPEGRSFDEPGRGGVYLGTATNTDGTWRVTTERIELSHRHYESITVDMTGADTRTEVARRLKDAVQKNGFGADCALRVTMTGSVPPNLAVPREADGGQLGLYYLELIDRTTPNYDALYLEKDMTARGELYRSLLPKLTGGTAEERATAARALRMGLSALAGEDITAL